MVRITDELLVSRAEHNDGALDTLEEISLHQQHLQKLEYINRVCSKLKILQLQDNCIERLENLSRLKSLEYLNMAMNNIEFLENLEGLESLNKLDLTLNFVGELSQGLTCLRQLPTLHHLYLMGNPCAEFSGYREFVIATLTRLKTLDGTLITKSERIKAIQALPKIKVNIQKAEREYKAKRQLEKAQAELEIEANQKEYDNEALDMDERRKIFYQSQSKHTPEYRKETQRFKEFLEAEDAKEKEPKFGFDWQHQPSRQRRLFDDNGLPLNVNEAKIEFSYNDSDSETLVVELKLWKFLDSGDITDLEVEPQFLRVRIKNKLFQLRFLEEVMCDRSVAQRSQTTGHLVVKIPKLNPVREPYKVEIKTPNDHAYLEVSDSMDFSQIVSSDSPPPLEDIDSE